MPRYTYLCESGHEVEISQCIKDPPLTVCIKEGVNATNGDLVVCCSPCKRLIGEGTSFILKGSGWTPKGS
jgi:predicted nucleic acid-binding Zn ribbon protein